MNISVHFYLVLVNNFFGIIVRILIGQAVMKLNFGAILFNCLIED